MRRNRLYGQASLSRAPEDYLLVTNAGGKWKALIPSNDEYPHAPWWHYRAEEEFWGYNPQRGFVGLSQALQVGALLELGKFTCRLRRFLSRRNHRCTKLPAFLDLYTDLSAVGWNGAELRAVKEKLSNDLQKTVVTDPALWFEYVLRPSMVFSTENQEFHEPFALAIKQEQQWLIETMEEDGSWPISWEWGQYPEAFPIAREWWKGDHIINYAEFLKW